jgi:DNA-nicking Smr family endonuclease
MTRRRAGYEPAADPAREFLDAVQDVQPLPDRGRVVHAPKPRAPLPLQRLEDDRHVLQDSLSDAPEADLELDSGDALSFTRPGVSRQVLRKLRGGHWARQDQLDLHGARVDEARALLVQFLAQAARRGQRCVLVIHGKGLGAGKREPVLKRKVAGWLVQRSEVLAFCQASAAEGGAGAVVVLLQARGAKLDAGAADLDDDPAA